MSLADYGTELARVLRASRHHVLLMTEAGEAETLCASNLLTGDWVMWDPARQRIQSVLPRHGVIGRKRAGRSAVDQPIAANVDVVLIVQGLDEDFNLRRLERYLLLAAACGTKAAVILNKADLTGLEQAESTKASVTRRTGAPAVLISALHSGGLARLDGLVRPLETAILLGSSGAGKSTLANALLGEQRQATGAVRASDGRGVHTTTSRELFLLPAGWWLIDTPGLREVEAWNADDALSSAFDDIGELSAGCRFRDCRHQSEPGCAVREAAAAGRLEADRLEHYWKLSREISAQGVRRKSRQTSKAVKQYKRMHDW